MLPTQAQNHPIDRPELAGLPSAPSGYRWFHTGSEYVLAAKLSGRVARSVPAPGATADLSDAFGR